MTNHNENMRRLNNIVDSWVRNSDPNDPFVFVVMHEFLHMCMADPEHADHLLGGDMTSADEGAGLCIDDMLGWGLHLARSLAAKLTPE